MKYAIHPSADAAMEAAKELKIPKLYKEAEYIGSNSPVWRVSQKCVIKHCPVDECDIYGALVGRRYRYVASIYGVTKDPVDWHHGFVAMEYAQNPVPDLEWCVDSLFESLGAEWVFSDNKVIKEILKEDGRYYDALRYRVVEMAESFRRNNIPSNDMHGGNIGMKNGHILAFDLVC